MAKTLSQNLSIALTSQGAKTATWNSGTLSLPLGESYMFILDHAAGTGTTPTSDVAIQITPDAGTTWYTVLRFAQVTTSASKQYIKVRNGIATGEAGSTGAIADTGGALNANVAFTPQIRVLATIGGTNPSFATTKVWVVVVPRGNDAV